MTVNIPTTGSVQSRSAIKDPEIILALGRVVSIFIVLQHEEIYSQEETYYKRCKTSKKEESWY